MIMFNLAFHLFGVKGFFTQNVLSTDMLKKKKKTLKNKPFISYYLKGKKL